MDSYHMAVGHRAGTPLDFQAIIADYEVTKPTRIVSVTSAASLATAIGQLNSGAIDVIVIEDGTYNFPAYQTPITAVRTASTIGYIGARNKGKVFVGLNPTSANPGNQWSFNGCQYIYAWMGMVFRYAYRTTTNPKLAYITNGAKFNRLTGFTLINCGGAPEDRVIDISFGSDDNVINNYMIDGLNGVAIATMAWDGAIRVSSVIRVGSTATYAFTPLSGYDLQTGYTVDVVGFTQPEYNVVGATITLVDSTHFSCTVSGTPVSPGTLAAHDLYPELIYPVANAEVRRTIHRIPQRTICEFGTYINITQNQVANNNNNNLLFQDATTRYGFGPRPTYSEIRNMWVHNVQTEWQMKCSYSKLHDIINVGPAGGGVSCRAGKFKEMYNIFNPYGGWGFKEDNNATWNVIAKSFALGEGGPADGTNDGIAQWNTIFAPIYECTLERVTLLQGGAHGTLDLFDQDGYSTYVTDIPVSDTAFKDFLLVSSISQNTTDTNGRSVPSYLTANNIIFDGFHYYLTNGATASITSSNNTSGDPVLEGGVRPTAASPSSILTGGVGSITTDMEGRPFTGRGGLGFTPIDSLFTTDFVGALGVNISDPASFIPLLNELGSDLITPTVSYLLNGSGAAYAATDFAANIINTNSTDHHIRIIWNAGGSNNRIRVWIGTNSNLTAGFFIEVYPNGNTVTIYESDGITLAFPVIPLTLSNTADIGIDGIKSGNHYTWRVNGWPMPTIVEIGTGQYVGWQRGLSINNAGIVKNLEIETEATSTGGGGTGGGNPSTPETLFSDTFTGAYSNITSTTPQVGTGYTLLAETSSLSSVMVRQGDGNFRANISSESAYALYTLGTSGTVTPYTTIRATLGYTNGAPAASAILLAQHVIDIANMPIVQWRKNSISLWFRQSGTFTQKGDVYSYSSIVGDYIDFEYTEDNHYKIYLNGNVIIDYDDSISPTFPNEGSFILGGGNFVQSTSLLHSNFGLTDFSINQYVEDPEVPSAAPVFITSPFISGVGNQSIIASASTDIAGKHYFTAHTEVPNYLITDLQDIIDGKAPSGTIVTTTVNDTSVSSEELTSLAIINLEELTTANKAPATINWGYTAVASDDTQMVTITTGTYDLPAPVLDPSVFDPGNPVQGDFFRRKYTNISLLNPEGFVLTTWPTISNNSTVEMPYYTNNGKLISLDSFGNLSVDIEGVSDTIEGINMYNYTTKQWEGEEILNLSSSTPIFTSSTLVDNSGVPIGSGILISYDYYINGDVDSPNIKLPDYSGIGVTDINSKLSEITSPQIGAGWVRYYKVGTSKALSECYSEQVISV